MTDWAWHEALKLGCQACGDNEQFEVADALRKAKADGMREAAQTMEDMVSLARFTDTIAQIRFAASKLDPS